MCVRFLLRSRVRLDHCCIDRCLVKLSRNSQPGKPFLWSPTLKTRPDLVLLHRDSFSIGQKRFGLSRSRPHGRGEAWEGGSRGVQGEGVSGEGVQEWPNRTTPTQGTRKMCRTKKQRKKQTEQEHVVRSEGLYIEKVKIEFLGKSVGLDSVCSSCVVVLPIWTFPSLSLPFCRVWSEGLFQVCLVVCFVCSSQLSLLRVVLCSWSRLLLFRRLL